MYHILEVFFSATYIFFLVLIMYSCIRACARVLKGASAVGVGHKQPIFSEGQMERLKQDAEERMMNKNALTLGEKHVEIGYYFEEVSNSQTLCFLSSNRHAFTYRNCRCA